MHLLITTLLLSLLQTPTLSVILNPNIPIPIPDTLDPQNFTSNDLLDPNIPCKPLTLLHCRGYLQPGNVGFYFGGELCVAVKEELGEENVAVQGIEYDGLFFGVEEKAREEFVRMVEIAGEKCGGETRVVVTGYSLGAYYVHAAAPDFPPDVEISSALTFGDMNLTNHHLPGFDVDVDMEKLPNIARERYKAFCSKGDDVCEGKGLSTKAPHLEYQKRIPEAVEFIKGWFERDEMEDGKLI